MSIITRPIKTGGGTDVVAGNDLLALEWNGDLNTIYTDYNGNIKNVNCASDMGLVGSKLADAPAGITRSKINDGEVITSKIPNDAIISPKIKMTSFSFLISASMGPGVTNNQSTGLLSANVIPLGIELIAAGAPTATVTSLQVQLYLNLSNDTYYLMWINSGSITQVFNHTAKVNFLMKA